MELNTRAVHAGREDLTDLGLHAVPIDLSTTYPARDSREEAARLDRAAAGVELGDNPIYGRVGNPTVARFERALADLEGAESAVAFATGMAALSACLLAVVAQGKRHIVAVRPLYGTSDHVIGSGLLGTEVTWSTVDSVKRDIRDDTGLVIVESPANPTLSEVDIRAIDVDVPVLVDNTFATPVLQRPIELGADIVLHSATKYLGGHGDVLGGVVACDEEFAGRLRTIRMATGGILHPLAGYLLLRGLSTLPIRIAHASGTAAELAHRLADHPGVARVYRPGIGGPMVSFDVVGDPHAVIGAVRLITPAVSLGSVDTLIQHPGSLSHHIVPEQDRHGAGIGDHLLRLSVGLEDVEDLWTDLDQALQKSYPHES